jgi:MFS transporter, OFA family, oxalate/formate antiporter
MGCVFGTCMGSALKLFPERRGFASGMIAAGYALGSAITVIPISRMIAASGYRQTFLVFGLLQGGAIVCWARSDGAGGEGCSCGGAR